MSSLKKGDYLNVAALVLSLLGVIVEIIGGAVFSAPVGVGMNTNLSPLMFVGIAMAVMGLVLAIIGSVRTEKEELNKILSTVALFAAILAVMFVPVYLVLTIVMPVLNPTNG